MPDVIAGILSWPYVVVFALLPAIALWMIWSARTTRGARLTTATAYIVWALGGFVGFHRVYLKNIWWILYIPLLAVLIYSWTSERRADAAFSTVMEQLESVDSATTRQKARAASATASIEDARAQLSETPSISEEDSGKLDLEIERENARATEARAEIAKIEAKIPILKSSLTSATAARRFWSDITFKTLLGILAFMLIDALLIPSMRRTAQLRENANA